MGLSIVPLELTEDEKKKGLSLQSPQVRNRFSINGKKRIQDMTPSPIYLKEDMELIICGNFEDNLSWISNADFKDRLPIIKEAEKVETEIFNFKPNLEVDDEARYVYHAIR